MGTVAKKSPVAAAPTSEVPALTVVKLKPRVDPAPKVDTRVAVVEPQPEVLEQLSEATMKSGDDDEPLGGSSADALFQAGLDALRTGNVTGGIEKLQRFASENPKHTRADNALYFAGLGLMGQGSYVEASRSFQQLLTSYPAGDAVADAMLKLAECRIRLNQPKDARVLYERVVAAYPGTSAASLAESRLGSFASTAATGSP